MNLRTALIVVVLALASACGSEPERPRSALLVTVDATNADALGCYGRVAATGGYFT